MKNAEQILSCITEALAASRSVLITDGTVTRKVIHVEMTDSNRSCHQECTFDVRLEDERWVQIPVSWPWDDLVGYGLTCLDDVLYIAPDWLISTSKISEVLHKR